MVSPQKEKSRSDLALEHLLAMHNAVSFVNDLSAEELLIITKSPASHFGRSAHKNLVLRNILM